MAKVKKTEAQVRAAVSRLSEQIAVLKERAREQGLAFTALDDKQLAKKVRGETSKSPFIYALGWTSGTSGGSPATFTAYVDNPDAVSYFPFYASIYFGLGNFFPVRDGWAGRDKRWPEFSSDRTMLSAGTSTSFTFSYTVPTGLPVGTYNGNVVIWEGEWLDVGSSFDRGSFDVAVW